MSIQQSNHQPSHGNVREQEAIIETDVGALSIICTELIERIFDNLDLSSLLSVADTCKRLQTIAAAQFGKRFSQKNIYLCDMNYFGRAHTPEIFWKGNRIEVIGLKLCLQLLRCFSVNILHLKLPYSHVQLEQYINRYCADTLSSISFMHDGVFPIENFPKPFKNVEKVHVAFVNVAHQLKCFVDAFPKLCHLEMTNIKLDENAIEVSFPHLKYLNAMVWTGAGSIENDLTTNHLTKFLRVNPQLQTLNVRSIGKINLIELTNMVSDNPMLLNLFIIEKFSHVNADELDGFVNEHPLIETLNFRYYEFSADDAIAFMRKLKSLKWFEFRVNCRAEIDHFLQQLDKETWQYSTLGIFIRVFKD